MTDSVKPCLDLRTMPKTARCEVEVHHAQTKNKRHHNVGGPYPKPIKVKSPLSGTGMELVTYWDGSGKDFLQSQIVGDMNLPNALTGQNCLHGTSVYAAGVAGLGLIKYQMACDGVPGSALDMLTTKDVTLHGATVTFLLEAETEEQAHATVLQLKTAACILGLAPTGDDSSNVTFYIRRNGFVLTVYQKTDFSHCVFPNDELAETFKARAGRMIRIEVYMQGHYLRKRGWAALESWRFAYAEGRYEAIFREMVRGLFNLEAVKRDRISPSVILRHKTPRQEAMKHLTATERAIVQAYLAGIPAGNLPSIKNGATTSGRNKIKSKWKRTIGEKLRIDITIPWEQHQDLRHAYLDRLLQYPGDYHPDAATVAYCFCKANWPKLLAHLRSLCQKEVKRHSMKQHAREYVAHVQGRAK